MSDAPSSPVDFTRDLVRWAESLAGIARTGLAFTESLYERERYEEVLHVAADIMAAAEDALETRRETDHLVHEWMKSVGHGVPGYQTPKVAVGAIVSDDDGRILLVQRADSGAWLYPTGWADIGYSPAEVAVKECKEECGIDVEVLGPLAILDGMRMGFTRIPLYSLVFLCRAVGGELKGHPLETSDVGFFAEDALPSPLVGVDNWGPMAFAAIRGDSIAPLWDRPRDPIWRGEPATPSADADTLNL
jgi:ADP-ribose pyrophosphatase YjhB (NUDIX family)